MYIFLTIQIEPDRWLPSP